jgi:hypothetical protein
MIEQIHNVSTRCESLVVEGVVVMNDTMSGLISEATLLSEVSDEVLEAAASIEGPARAFSPPTIYRAARK